MKLKPQKKPKPKLNTGRPLDLEVKRKTMKLKDWKVR